MAFTTPKTNYQDDVLNTNVNQLRKYNVVDNADGSISLIDVTNYSQVGTFVGAKELNDIGTDISYLNDNKVDKTGKASDVTVDFTIATTEADIVTGEKMSVILGKVLKSINTIRTALTGKINTSQIINNLASTVTGNVLDATQGKVLKDLYDALMSKFGSLATTKSSASVSMGVQGSNGYYAFTQVPLSNADKFTIVITGIALIGGASTAVPGNYTVNKNKDGFNLTTNQTDEVYRLGTLYPNRAWAINYTATYTG